MYTIISNGSSKIIIKNIKYKLNKQPYIEIETDARTVLGPCILINRYDTVTTFGKKVQ